MFRINNLLLFVLCLLISACGTDPSPSGKTRTAGEDELVDRLSGLMISSPATQEQQDRNLLINYAIDSLLDVQMTPSGIFYTIDNPDEGPKAKYNSQVSVNYRGRLLNGKEFDSSYRRGESLYINVQQVIQGWQQGLQMLKKGGKGTFLIPSHLAYGNNSFSGLIPPNSSLRFEVELVEIHGEK